MSVTLILHGLSSHAAEHALVAAPSLAGLRAQRRSATIVLFSPSGTSVTVGGIRLRSISLRFCDRSSSTICELRYRYDRWPTLSSVTFLVLALSMLVGLLFLAQSVLAMTPVLPLALGFVFVGLRLVNRSTKATNTLVPVLLEVLRPHGLWSISYTPSRSLSKLLVASPLIALAGIVVCGLLSLVARNIIPWPAASGAVCLLTALLLLSSYSLCPLRLRPVWDWSGTRLLRHSFFSALLFAPGFFPHRLPSEVGWCIFGGVVLVVLMLVQTWSQDSTLLRTRRLGVWDESPNGNPAILSACAAFGARFFYVAAALLSATLFVGGCIVSLLALLGAQRLCGATLSPGLLPVIVPSVVYLGGVGAAIWYRPPEYGGVARARIVACLTRALQTHLKIERRRRMQTWLAEEDRGLGVRGPAVWCTACTRRQWAIVMPRWVEQLSDEEITALMMHEFGHIVLHGQRLTILRAIGAVSCMGGASLLPLGVMEAEEMEADTWAGHALRGLGSGAGLLREALYAAAIVRTETEGKHAVDDDLWTRVWRYFATSHAPMNPVGSYRGRREHLRQLSRTPFPEQRWRADGQ